MLKEFGSLGEKKKTADEVDKIMSQYDSVEKQENYLKSDEYKAQQTKKQEEEADKAMEETTQLQ